MRRLGVATWREAEWLARVMGQVVKAKAATLALFLIGWAGFNLTVMVTGLMAPRWPWVVVPLMAAGCLVQLVVTLAGYRLSIQQADALVGAPPLPDFSLVTMVSTLLVPFAAAYSAFGFFSSYAREAVIAGESLVGSYAGLAFGGALNPRTSPTTLVIVLGAFAGLWVATRLTGRAAQRTNSTVLALLRAYLAACTTFLVLFSMFRLYAWLASWIDARAFMQWYDRLVGWVDGLVGFDLPRVIEVSWGWIAQVAWPLVWDALAQPVLWLSVVALVGGMQFLDVDTVWARLRSRLGLRRARLDEGLPDPVGQRLRDRLEPILVFLHLLSVTVRAGLPFLGALVVSFAVLDRVGDWLGFGVAQAVGPIGSDWVFFTSPVLNFVDSALMPGATAVLLAVAYARMRRRPLTTGAAAAPAPVGSAGATGSPHPVPLWQQVLLVVVCVGLAAGISLARPGLPDRLVPLVPGQAAQVGQATVVVDDLRVGRAVTGYAFTDAVYPSLGVFVVVRVSVGGYASTAWRVEAQLGDVTYREWTGGAGTVATDAGFTTTRDLVFEVPAEGLDDLVLTVTPIQAMISTLAIGQFEPVPGLEIDEVVVVDELVVRVAQ